MNDFIHILISILPIFFISFIGILLKYFCIIDDQFVKRSAKIVFMVALPALIFITLSDMDFNQFFNGKMILYNYIGAFVAFATIWFFAFLLVSESSDRGAFIYGSFNGNTGIVGFAVILNLFGESGLAKASILVASGIPVYNFLSILALIVTSQRRDTFHFKKIVIQVISNPIIFTAILAMMISLLRIPIPKLITNTGEYLSSLTLPLALIGIGGSLNFKYIRKASKTACIASIMKLIWMPFILTFGALLLSFTGENLGILFVLFACPSAISTFILVEALGGNSKLAGNITLITTLVSGITITLGIFSLRALGFL